MPRGQTASYVPVLRIEHLTAAEKKAYILADNKLAEKAGWDKELLAIEFQELMRIETDFDLTLTGFETPEIDLILDEVQDVDKDDILPEMDKVPERCQKGEAPHTNNIELGKYGRHRSNVWNYPGMRKGKDGWGLHTTVKPVRLITDAIMDCSKTGDLILDGFGGQRVDAQREACKAYITSQTVYLPSMA